MAARDVVIVGAGINGLVAGWRLAAAGRKPLVLEARPMIGGSAITEEFHAGFKCSTLAHAGAFDFTAKEFLQLGQHGYDPLDVAPAVSAILPDGRALLLYGHPERAAESIKEFSPRDAVKYPDFHRTCWRLAEVLSRLRSMTPPSLDDPSAGDLWNLLSAGRKVRGLGSKDMLRLLRWGPMAIADFVEEWFESDLLQAAIAARGIFGAALGPMSAGSTAVFLLRSMADVDPAGATMVPRGGMGALSEALAWAARKAGAEIRTDARVAHISVKDGIATGVVLANGDEIAAKAVVSNADPRRTLLGLVDPVHLDPSFVVKMRNYRCRGNVAKINLAIDGLPSFSALSGTGLDRGPKTKGHDYWKYWTAISRAGELVLNPLAARIHIGPTVDYLERAYDASKYGRWSEHPVLEVMIPTVADPSLAPSGKHVMSIYAQYAPYALRGTDWNAQRDPFADTVIRTLAEYAPDLPGRILHRQVITPLDLEQTWGLTGGHLFHGELALDQLFTMRPLVGWADYRTPIRGLYLCGSGTHPGVGFTGDSGTNCAREVLRDLK